MRVHALKVGQVDCWLLDDGALAVPPEILVPRDRREAWPTFQTDAHGLVEVPVICLFIRSAGPRIGAPAS